MIRFGDVELDVRGRELRRRGRVEHLEPQAFDLLVALVEQRDRVVSKHELLDGVWGHRFLSEANLTTRIKEIRRALGDDGVHQHTIKNVRGRGYRFVADVDAEDDPPAAGGHTDAMLHSGLIGRERELGAVVAALGRSPVVTLIGPGGVGKSTLARAVADLAAVRPIGGSTAEGVHVVELATLEASEQVLPAIARALDVVVERDRHQRAVGTIAARPVLLLLDNCEHVVDEVAMLLDGVLAVSGARVRVLATSQIRLGLGVEELVPVRPLDVEEAVALFTARARAVQADWTIDTVGRRRVAALVAGLDQLPLTIEMAAARLGSMTFDELEQAIAAGAPMPMSHRSPARRHRSLDSLVRWSTELLDPALRRTLVECSVFAGPVTAADLAAVVTSSSGSAVFDLAALAERSLLAADVRGNATRYRMLATVSAVASRWLEESGTADDVRSRHARHIATTLRVIDRQIRTPDEAEARARLDTVTAEVRSAHRWARRHDPALAAEMSASLHLAAYSSFWNEPSDWSDSLLAARRDGDGDVDGLDLTGARLLVAGAAANRGDLAGARTVATDALASADPRARATALEILADVEIYDGRLAAAMGATAELRELGAMLGDAHVVAMAAVDAALGLTFGGDPANALVELDTLDEAALAPSDRAWVVYARGEALSFLGDAQAAATFAVAVQLAHEIGNPFVRSVARMSLATEHARAGRHRASLDAFAECLDEYARHGNYVHAVTTLRNLVEVLVAVGDDRGAALLAGATSSDLLRPSYGIETERLSSVVADVEQRAGADRFGEWTADGRALDLPQAVQVAAELVDRHRG